MGSLFEVSSTTGTVETPLVQGKVDRLTLQPVSSSGEGVYIKDDLGSTIITVKSGVATLTSTSQSGDITLTNQHAVVFQDTEGSPKSVTLESPTTITSSYVLRWPVAQSVGSQGLANDGSGNLSWVTLTGSGTVNSGTAGRLSLYATSTNAVSDTYIQNAHNITLTIATQGTRSADLAITVPNPGDAVTSANILSDTDTNSYTLAGTYTLSNHLTITPTTNQLVLGTTRTITLTAPTPATSSRTWTIPDLLTSPTFAALEGTQTFSGVKTFSSVPVLPTATYTASTASPVTPSAVTTEVYNVTVDANLTINGFTSPYSGQKILLQLHNDASHAVTFATGSGNFRFGTDIPSYTATPSKTDYVGVVWNATDSFWDIVSLIQGF